MKDVANFFKVLADEVRIKILWLLFNNRELCVCEIMAMLETTQSKASRHLATLRHAGLVKDRRDGTWSYYSICPAEGALERAQLESLKAGLEKLPGAVALLRKHRECMTRQEGKPSCAVNGTRPAATTKERPASRRAKLAGGSR